MIHYDPSKSIKENAEMNNCSEANVRKHIQSHRIDRRGDEFLRRYMEITKLKKQGLSLRKIASKTGYSITTVRKYVNEGNEWKNYVDLTKESHFQRGINSDNQKAHEEQQHKILRSILRFYVHAPRFDADLTYSIGKFYTGINKPIYKFDIKPQSDDVLPLSEAYNLEPESMGSVVIDLPYIIRKSTSNRSLLVNRFSGFDSLADLQAAYENTMKLADRLLREEGIMVVKTQDTNSGGKQIWVHQIVERLAEELNFDIEDIFLHISPNVMSRPNLSIQRHGRKYHSYFYVLKKRKKK